MGQDLRDLDKYERPCHTCDGYGRGHFGNPPCESCGDMSKPMDNMELAEYYGSKITFK